jgi:hypothetical protein
MFVGRTIHPMPVGRPIRSFMRVNAQKCYTLSNCSLKITLHSISLILNFRCLFVVRLYLLILISTFGRLTLLTILMLLFITDNYGKWNIRIPNIVVYTFVIEWCLSCLLAHLYPLLWSNDDVIHKFLFLRVSIVVKVFIIRK